ncbi:MAG: oxygen-independent coproporphyrinogen III oxidase [Pseudomonadota bacterium]
MNSIAMKYATARAPRYTSYPTAPHFQKGFPEATYRTWLARRDAAEPISLYLHVPFCRRMCWYCGCSMKLARRYGPVSDYLEALLAEIDLVTGVMPGGQRVAHVHWGGGSPTVLSPDDLSTAMNMLHRRFAILSDAEIAIEIDPRTLTDELVAVLGGEGFNRASLGVQEFDPTVQAAINREQPFSMVAQATAGLREAGVSAINFDLMYGLPFQTAAMLAKTVDMAVGLRPDRIALFGYAHVPWMAKNQRMIPEDALPNAAERLEQSEVAAERLVSHGYRRIGLDHFALPDDPMAGPAQLRRNFQGYTTDTAETLIGLGASSISALPLGYVQNVTETGAYARAVRDGVLPIAKGRALDDDDRLRRSVIERLMCDLQVDLEAEALRFGAQPDYFEPEIERLGDLQDHGLVRISDGSVVITEAGRPVMRAVASVFDAYLNVEGARHSKIA